MITIERVYWNLIASCILWLLKRYLRLSICTLLVFYIIVIWVIFRFLLYFLRRLIAIIWWISRILIFLRMKSRLSVSFGIIWIGLNIRMIKLGVVLNLRVLVLKLHVRSIIIDGFILPLTDRFHFNPLFMLILFDRLIFSK